jgi:hypothetical protein
MVKVTLVGADSRMSKTNTVKEKPLFFLIMGFVGLFAVLAGFAKTFFIPVSAGTFKGPLMVYIHGAFAFSWVCLFLVQSVLILNKKLTVHKSLGYWGIFIASGAAVTIVPAGLYAVEKELAQGLGETAISTILGVVTSALMYFLLVIAGIFNRRKPELHKRLMLLATIALLWPAWFRLRHYFPSVPDPEIWFALVLADSFIIISLLRDKIVVGKVIPAFLFVGLFIIAEHSVEVLMFDSAPWRVMANMIYGALKY